MNYFILFCFVEIVVICYSLYDLYVNGGSDNNEIHIFLYDFCDSDRSLWICFLCDSLLFYFILLFKSLAKLYLFRRKIAWVTVEFVIWLIYTIVNELSNCRRIVTLSSVFISDLNDYIVKFVIWLIRTVVMDCQIRNVGNLFFLRSS